MGMANSSRMTGELRRVLRTAAAGAVLLGLVGPVAPADADSPPYEHTRVDFCATNQSPLAEYGSHDGRARADGSVHAEAETQPLHTSTIIFWPAPRDRWPDCPGDDRVRVGTDAGVGHRLHVDAGRYRITATLFVTLSGSQTTYASAPAGHTARSELHAVVRGSGTACRSDVPCPAPPPGVPAQEGAVVVADATSASLIHSCSSAGWTCGWTSFPPVVLVVDVDMPVPGTLTASAGLQARAYTSGSGVSGIGGGAFVESITVERVASA